MRVHVVEAKDLMKKDIGVLGKGKSDPYAIVTVGSQQFRTQTIDSNVNPKWDYWCEVCQICLPILIDSSFLPHFYSVFFCCEKCCRSDIFLL